MKFDHISKTCVLFCVVAGALLSAGCTEASFNGGQTESSQGTDPDHGVLKNSYFFVKRTADILFVIDNSRSMAGEQELLRNGFPSFTSTINAASGGTLDWHIAITTTDVVNTGPGRQGELVPFSSAPPNTYFLSSAMNVDQANTAFQATVTVGIGGSGSERGIAAARMLAQREYAAATSRGFLRPDTPLSVIVLSDEDEASTGRTSPQFGPINDPANFISGIRELDTLSSGLKTITFHSVVAASNDCLAAGAAHIGTTYMELSTMTDGIIGDICALNASYQEQLESLAVNIVNEAKTYSLPCGNIAPDSVRIYEQELGGALTLVPSTFLPPNKAVLANAPAVGSLIKAHFTCLD